MNMPNNAQQIQQGAHHHQQQQQQQQQHAAATSQHQQYSIATPGSMLTSMPLNTMTTSTEASMMTASQQLTQIINGQTIANASAVPVASMSNMQAAPVIADTTTIINSAGTYVQATSSYNQPMTLNSIPNIVASSNEASSAQILAGMIHNCYFKK
jgi:hypothetical protein